jgi:hypothetical protein
MNYTGPNIKVDPIAGQNTWESLDDSFHFEVFDPTETGRQRVYHVLSGYDSMIRWGHSSPCPHIDTILSSEDNSVTRGDVCRQGSNEPL